MKFHFFFLFLLFLYYTICDSIGCDPMLGLNTFNPSCGYDDTPYCRMTSKDPPSYECTECISNCDCDLDDVS